MSSYNAKKKPELEALLKERGLPHTGNKADLVARLQEDDAKQGSADAPAATGGEEDNIDWDDEGADTNQAAAADATTEAGRAALQAGGIGRVDNPVAVPNQVQDAASDPAKDDSLTVVQPGTEPAAAVEEGGGEEEGQEGQESEVKTDAPATAAAAAAAAPKLTAEELAAKKEAEEAKFKAGLAASDVDAEAEKRRKRAERFGIQVSEEDKKTDERARRFGTTGEEASKTVSLLDKALPERQERKRGRERADVGGWGGNNANRSEKRVDSRRRRGGDGAGAGAGAGAGKERDAPRAQSGFNSRDKEAMKKRLERFGGAKQTTAS